MFGLTTREIVQQEVRALRNNIGKTLFGRENQDCYNLRGNPFIKYSQLVAIDGFADSDRGVIGQFADVVLRMNVELEELKEQVAKLQKRRK